MSTEPSPVPTSSVRESGASANVRASADGWRSKRSAPERASHAITVDPFWQQPRANSDAAVVAELQPAGAEADPAAEQRPARRQLADLDERVGGALRLPLRREEPPVGGDGGPPHGIGVAQAVQDGAARRVPDRDAPGRPAGGEPAAVGREREPARDVPVAGRQRAVRRFVRRSTSAVVPSPWLVAISAPRGSITEHGFVGHPLSIGPQKKRRPSRRPPSGSHRLTMPSLVPSRARPWGSSTTPWRILRRGALNVSTIDARLHVPDVACPRRCRR